MITDDREIIDAVKQNPEYGYRMLVKKYMKAIYWHIRRLVISHDDAQDATQETFVRVFRYFAQYANKGSLSAWIYKIATHEAWRVLDGRKRAESVWEDVALEMQTVQADSYVDYSDLELVKLQRAIYSLSPKQQVTFNLRYYDELDYDEIAVITDSTVAGSKMNYHLAKAKIIEYMNSHD